MHRHGLFAVLFLIAIATTADAQTAWRFKWTKGETLTTKVDHVTAVTETIGGKKSEITSKLTIVKRWRVLDVDAQGTATLEQSIASLRNEQTRPGGDVLLFDSTNLEKSTPELKGMAKFINVPIAVIKVDVIGRVLEVTQGPKTKYESEPPFAFVLPGQPVQPGQAWTRPFTITVDPPLGAGEKYEAQQMVKLLSVEANKATLSLATTLKNPPTTPSEQTPLLQKEMSGQVVFDTTKGQVERVQLSVDRTVEKHQGDGSSYRFASNYVEQAIEPVPLPIVPTSGTKKE